ncbi:MAG TPA: 50S ribosomal protein L20 [Candidatus Cloacimonadota bacterium]|jgi:large subunit ribosomal protein L20|nr:50S ribosomal protein L20 [Candidatus Cloacimonadota bacterium]
MPRSTNNVASHRRHKKFLKAARGYYGAKSKLYRTARQAVEKGLGYAYRDRKQKKRQFRQLWIVRINAAARINGMSYSNLIDGLNKANINVNRKTLAHLAWHEPAAFTALCETAKSAKGN